MVAPGGDSGDFNGDGYPDGVLSTGGDDSRGMPVAVMRFMNGTSMAAPHAGVAALMRSVNPTLTPAAFDQLLAGGLLTEDIGAAGRDNQYGFGLIDARKAVVAASSASPPPTAPRLIATPGSLNFGSNQSIAELVIRNGGGGTMTISCVFRRCRPVIPADAGHRFRRMPAGVARVA